MWRTEFIKIRCSFVKVIQMKQNVLNHVKFLTVLHSFILKKNQL